MVSLPTFAFTQSSLTAPDLRAAMLSRQHATAVAPSSGPPLRQLSGTELRERALALHGMGRKAGGPGPAAGAAGGRAQR